MKKFYLYYSGISTIVCISASLVYSCVYKNTPGAIWAGLAALVSAQCFSLHSLYFSNKLKLYYRQNTLNRFHVVSFIIVLVASTFLIWYIFAMVYWKTSLFKYDKTPVFPCVFSFIAGKWGLHMYEATKEYSEYLSPNYSPAVQAFQ